MARTKQQRIETYQSGLWAETCASLWLRLKGYRLLERRYKTPVGEIDIIARRGRTLAFVEVKRRNVMDDALFCVKPETAMRVRRAAEWWLKAHAGLADKCDIRFDVIALAPYAGIRHVPNAF